MKKQCEAPERTIQTLITRYATIGGIRKVIERIVTCDNIVGVINSIPSVETNGVLYEDVACILTNKQREKSDWYKKLVWNYTDESNEYLVGIMKEENNV